MKNKVDRVIYVAKNYWSFPVDKRVEYLNTGLMAVVALALFVFGAMAAWTGAYYDYKSFMLWVGLGIMVLTPFVARKSTVKGFSILVAIGSVYAAYMLAVYGLANGGFPEGLTITKGIVTAVLGASAAIVVDKVTNALEVWGGR